MNEGRFPLCVSAIRVNWETTIASSANIHRQIGSFSLRHHQKCANWRFFSPDNLLFPVYPPFSIPSRITKPFSMDAIDDSPMIHLAFFYSLNNCPHNLEIPCYGSPTASRTSAIVSSAIFLARFPPSIQNIHNSCRCLLRSLPAFLGKVPDCRSYF